MTLKIVSAAVLTASCFFAGNAAGDRLKMRCEDLSDLISALIKTENYIEGLSLPLPRIYERLSGEGRVGQMFKAVLDGSGTVREVWENGLSLTALSEEDKKEVMRLSAVLGADGRKQQQKHIELCLSELEKNLEDAEKRQKLDGALYKRMGAYIGALVAIILF